MQNFPFCHLWKKNKSAFRSIRCSWLDFQRNAQNHIFYHEFYLVTKTVKTVFCLHKLKKLTTSRKIWKQGSGSRDLKAFLKLKSRKKSGSNWKTSQQGEEPKCFPFSFIATCTTNQKKSLAKKCEGCFCFPIFWLGDKGDSFKKKTIFFKNVPSLDIIRSCSPLKLLYMMLMYMMVYL